MAHIAVRVENLDKKYHIGVGKKRQDTLRDVLTNFGPRMFNLFSPKYQSDDIIYALNDVSFEIKEGEIVGIIGCNGAGKSTLLKILSRLTEPSRGWAEIYGRTGCILEVGTGFHPELTGQENIYLNGAILGMARAEIKRKFDEIVAFAEIERFLYTPVKHYSSGMYVRLAFAVAAHLDPDVLLVDEVLAVGDVNFQRKCINKMREVGKEGRTVIFISHNMMAVTIMCSRAILMNKGKIISDGPSQQVISKYLDSGMGTKSMREWTDTTKAPGNEIVRLKSVRVRAENGETTDVVDVQQAFGIEMEYEVLKSGYVLTPNFHFYNEEGLCVFVISDSNSIWTKSQRPEGKYTSLVQVPGNLLSECVLVVGAAISTMNPVEVHFFEAEALIFRVVDNLGNNPTRGECEGKMPGSVRPLLKWATQYYPNVIDVKFDEKVKL